MIDFANPVTSERLRWHVTSEESGGRLARVELWLGSGHHWPTHAHPTSEECLEVLAGAVELTIGDAPDRIAPGESARIPAGIPHELRALEDAHLFVEWLERGAMTWTVLPV